MGLERSHRRIGERMRILLAGDGSLRTDTRRRIGMEDGSFVSPPAAEALDTAERHGAVPDAALAAGTAVALLDAFVRVRTGIEPGNETDAINPGDLLLSLALDEAWAAGPAVFERTLAACVEWIESGDPEALKGTARATGEVAAASGADGRDSA